MRYSLLSAAILALTSSVFAQDSTPFFDEFIAPTEGQQLVAGKTFDITWLPGTKPEYLSGTATIHLLQGSTTKDLQVGPLVVAGVKNSLGKYTWTVPADAAFTLYGLRITLDDDKSTPQKEDTIFQYSFPFQISKAAASGTVTVQLGTGTAFTPEPTTTSTSTKSATNTSSIITSTFTSATASVSAFPTNSANGTVVTSATRTAGPASTTAKPPAQITGNSAAANAVSGGLMLVGGIVLAFAL